MHHVKRGKASDMTIFEVALIPIGEARWAALNAEWDPPLDSALSPELRAAPSAMPVRGGA